MKTKFNKSLYPHFEDGRPNLSAQGHCSVVYTHPDDLHMTAIFDGVSIEFAEEYLGSREWCRDAVGRGWNFYLLPEILAERMTIQ
jgi:hypothetical protein